jgi:hypothetical protein
MPRTVGAGDVGAGDDAVDARADPLPKMKRTITAPKNSPNQSSARRAVLTAGWHRSEV